MTSETPRPPRDCPLAIVTGAPGAGKTTTVAALLRHPRDYLVFDTDILLPDLAALAGRSGHDTEELWLPFRRLCVTLARMVGHNGRQAVLCIPIEPHELAAALPDAWHGAVAWCLLDCDDATRRARLLARGWDERAIAEASNDARALRQHVPFVIDTGQLSAEAIATAIDRWLRGQGTESTAATTTGEIANVL